MATKKRDIIKVSDVYKDNLLDQFMHIRKFQMLIKIYKDTFENWGTYKKNKERLRYFVYADKVDDFLIFIKTTRLQVLKNGGKK